MLRPQEPTLGEGPPRELEGEEPRTPCLHWLNQPLDGAGLRALRALLGALLLFSTLRFLAMRWVEELYLSPNYHFSFLGFEWIKALPAPGMYALFGVMILAALGLCLGVHERLSSALFCICFTYVELIDKTPYLNHYYLVSLLTALLALVPTQTLLNQAPSNQARPNLSVPRWAYLLLRAQVGLVYFYAGFAKLDSDWLLRAEPLRTWLQSYESVPLVGALLFTPAAAYAMSWFGAVFDLCLPFALLAKRTRAWAYLVAVMFHAAIWLLFPVGVFSWLMLAATTVFFEPAWPRMRRLPRFLKRWFESATPASEDLLQSANAEAQTARSAPPMRHALAFGVGVYLVVQFLVPLRHLLYPGWVNWTEEGYRFAWRVMLIEKTGQTEYRVVQPDGTERRIFPRRELSRFQYRQLVTQPDMIHQYALHLGERHAQNQEPARVYADAWVSLNGRPSQRIISPDVDLAAYPLTLSPKPFLVELHEP